MPSEMLPNEEHRREKTPPVPTAAKEDGVVAAPPSSTGKERLPRWLHWRHASMRWLLVGVVVAAAVAVTVDRTAFSGGTGIPTTSALAPTRGDPADDAAATVVAKYRERIPELMAEQGIPGLAVALVDEDRTVWLAGFGRLDGRGSAAPVNGDTIFSIQSISKLFTATAVMQAVAAGRLDLDEPITTYLPGFTVHSAFEEHPERKITLRMLLSHTAGFTHEAPVGNSNELDPGTFDAHVRSISDTWLRFPVGTGLAYSNLGIDLAGFVLERVMGKPFPEVARELLLEPLGMRRSTFDRATIRARGNRAVGQLVYPDPPLYEPMTAAGGLYTSARDLARFLRFQLNGGSLDGRVVLERKWIDEMRTVPPPHGGAAAGYALGVVRHRWNTWPDLFEHGGGGNGFLADLWWAPEVGIGIAVLTNSDDHQLQNEHSVSILTDLLREPGAYRDRALAFSGRAGVDDPNTDFAPPAGLARLVTDAAMPARGDEARRWAGYSGLYRTVAWDVLEIDGPPARFLVDAGIPYFEGEDRNEVFGRHRLAEIEPGLFLADDGETLDLRGPVPTWRNFRLVRVSDGPSPWQWAILGAAALVAVTWLGGALARTVRRSPASRPATSRWRYVAATVAAATALSVLAAVALLAWLPGLVDAGFLGWLELPLAERLALHLPLAVAVLGTSTAALVMAAWIGRWWPSAVKLQYCALAIAAVALTALLAGWDLIGWGMT